MTAEKVLGSHVGHVHVRQRLRDSERSLPAGALPRRLLCPGGCLGAWSKQVPRWKWLRPKEPEGGREAEKCPIARRAGKSAGVIFDPGFACLIDVW